MSCKYESCIGKIINSGRYKGKQVCDFPDGIGGYANCNKLYIGLDEFNPSCSNNPLHMRSCCKISTCITKTPTKTPTNDIYYNIYLIILTIFITVLYITILLLLLFTTKK